ncbi:MCSU3 [Symbiodinium natans]|uniref:MCSU3 protein n=1 Tax=Symbiodinium natans TaxID=878477 RepID=A0A812V8G9_9DINO|nr:MCSU3 [Symbiodinium natans]
MDEGSFRARLCYAYRDFRDESADNAHGWVQKQASQQFRGKREKFWSFTLQRPFGNEAWVLQVRVAQPKDVAQEVRDKRLEEISELLFRMAADTGAIRPESSEAGEENLKTLGRLQRLEKRFTGKGVTESEARNALRLFERELSKANWTAEKFEKLKKQLAGTEEWSAADMVAESSIRWQQHRRRQAWFADACERVAVPLGIEAGYTNSGGCFVGPLSSVAGAALTTTLLCHLAHLDLNSATARNRRLSAPQFLQGFVDGALNKDRYLVWERLFSIEDGASAARFCQEHLNSGFFDDLAPESEGQSGEDLQDMLRSFFSSIAASGSSRARPRAARLDEDRAEEAPSSLPSSFTPFSGKAHRLDADDEAQEPAPGDDTRKSWALTFTSNLELARTSRRRSREEAKRTYHWTFSGQAVKETKTGTESYSQGKSAGEKRKGQIESAAGAGKQFRKAQRLAITR